MKIKHFFKTLSGRFVVLTVIFVMLAEVMIFLPSIAKYRVDFLNILLERGQIASLALLTTEEKIAPALEAELLINAGVLSVTLQRDETRELILSLPTNMSVDHSYDLRNDNPIILIKDALSAFFETKNHLIRVIGVPAHNTGIMIEVVIQSRLLRNAMLSYAGRILVLSAFISVLTAILLVFVVSRIIVRPIQRVISYMQTYAQAPEDIRCFITPSSNVTEIRDAEEALQSLQIQLSNALKQKERLANLGAAVAKISHDLRNILTTGQIFADRIETSTDPIVARIAPKLVNAIQRAVRLCEATLRFGKAEESPPNRQPFLIRDLVESVIESDELEGHTHTAYHIDIQPNCTLLADQEQIYRVIANLVRNARQAIENSKRNGQITISLEETKNFWHIKVADTGPGFPMKAKENLFKAFQGGVRKGGTGLGLVIAYELILGHGGTLSLIQSDKTGATFSIKLPK